MGPRSPSSIRSRPAPLRARVAAAAVAALALAASCAPRHEPGATAAAISQLRGAGRFEAARDAAREALRRLEATRGAARWRIAEARHELATLERIAALPESARRELASVESPAPSLVRGEDDWRVRIPALERQLAVRARWLGDDHPDVADTRSALARLECALGSPVTARRLDERALAARRRAFGDRHPRVIESLKQLGDDLKLSGQARDSMLQLRTETAALAREVLGEHSSQHAQAVLDLANMMRWARPRADCDRTFGYALRLHRRLYGEESRAVAEVLADWGVTLARWGSDRPAVALLRRALAILDRLGGPSETVHAMTLNSLGRSLMRLGRYAEARPILGRSALLQEARRARARQDQGRSQAFSVVAWVDLGIARVELGDSALALDAADRGLSRGLFERAVERGRADAYGAWDGLVARLSRALPETTAVIGWLDSPTHGTVTPPYWGFVVRRQGGIRWFSVVNPLPPGVRNPERDLAEYGNRMLATGAWPIRVGSGDVSGDYALSLWRSRVAPMEPHLAGVRELVVLSPNAHAGVPLEILRDDRGRWLADRFVVTYLPSAALFLAGLERAAPRPDPRDWDALLIASPGVDSEGAAEPPLEGIVREIRAVGARVRRPTTLAGSGATEAALHRMWRSGRLGTFGLVHVASRQAVNFYHPREGGLILADADPTASVSVASDVDSTNGVVTADEVARWNLGARLVMLASCQSRGGLRTRSEGFTGLGQAALEAGARSVIVSLWPVEDRATGLFVERFYEALMPRSGPAPSVAAALRRARLQVREWRAPDGSRPYAHPAYWGAFVLIGDPG